MNFNAHKFCTDYNIPIVKTGKHYREGWINIGCPFCGNKSALGIHIESGAVSCYVCGKGKSQVDVIMALLSCDFPSAKDIQEDYSNNQRVKQYAGQKETDRKAHATECVWPSGTVPLNAKHRAYLEARGFNAEHIEAVWGLRGTGHLSDYKFRIIAPIVINGNMISYQGRDITGKSELRYKACKQENEVIEHQTVVYGIDMVKNRKCLIVEGIVDAWRMGRGSVSCFGIAWTLQQVEMIVEYCDLVYILFDAEEQAQKQAHSLAIALNARGLEVEILDISDTPSEHLVDPTKGIDPGNLKQEYADVLLRELEFI